MVVASVPPAPSRCRWVAWIGSGWIPKAALEQHPWKKKDGEIFEGTMTILNNPKKKPPSSLKSSQKNQTARHRVFGISQASQAEVPWHFSRALTRATATSRYQVCKAACPEIDGCSILQSVAVPILTHDKYVSCVYLCIYIYMHTVTLLWNQHISFSSALFLFGWDMLDTRNTPSDK